MPQYDRFCQRIVVYAEISTQAGLTINTEYHQICCNSEYILDSICV